MIELKAIKQRDEKRQIAYIILDDLEFAVSNVPIELDTNAKVLTWLKKKEDHYMFLILQKMYRDGEIWADWQRFKTDENTKLQAMQKWVKAGHKNLIGKEDGKDIYRVIKKQIWRSAHPKGLVLKSQIAKAKTVADIKKILEKIII